jgi:glucose/arabinose dehydrogenase
MKKIVLLVSCLVVSTVAYSDPNYTIKSLAKNLGTPWGMAFITPNQMLISEREAHLKLLNIQSGEIIPISGLPSMRVEGQGGFFDVAIPPNYADSDWIYFSYNKDVNGQGATTLARAKLSNATLTDWQDLLVTQSRSGKEVHYGGRITFDNEGHVFLSVGERGVRDNAQDLTTHAGSILRLNLDGSVPKDNPFINNTAALAEIWSYGHRNPQGLFFNQQTGQLWESEHGPRGGDEINLIEAGKNYGWATVSYGKEYWAPLAVGEATEKAGMEQPIQVYIPSIAPSNLIQYTGNAFSDWQGNFLLGSMAYEHINRIEIDAENNVINEERLMNEPRLRIRNVIEDAAGLVYVSTDSGDIFQLTP